MKTPEWYRQLQADAKNIRRATRLTSIFFRRCWRSVARGCRRVFEIGLLNLLMIVPIFLGRALGKIIRTPFEWVYWLFAPPLRLAYRVARRITLHLLVPMVVVPARWMAVQWRAAEIQFNRFLLHARLNWEALRELGLITVLLLTPFFVVRISQSLISTGWSLLLFLLLLPWRTLRLLGKHLWAVAKEESEAFVEWLHEVHWGRAWWPVRALGIQCARLWLSFSRGCRAFFSNLRWPDWDWGVLLRPFAPLGGLLVVVGNGLLALLFGSPDRARERLAELGITFGREGNTPWAIASMTGTVGIILLFLMHFSSLVASPKPDEPQALSVAVKSPQPSATSQPVVHDVTYAPDPLEDSPPAQTEPTPFDPFAEFRTPRDLPDPPPQTEPPVDEFRFPLPPEPPELDVDVVRLEVDRLRRPSVDDEQNTEILAFAESRPPSVEEILRSVMEDGLPGLMRDLWARAVERRRPEATIQPTLYRDRVPAATREFGEDAVLAPPPFAEAPRGPRDVNVSIARRAPETLTVQQPVTYQLIVRNESDETLEQVVVEEHIPEEFAITDAFPPASVHEGALKWKLRQLEAGAETTLNIELVPTAGGEMSGRTVVRSFATVAAATQIQPPVPETPEIEREPRPAPPRDLALPEPERPRIDDRSSPQLRLEVAVAERVPQGRRCLLKFRVTNVGLEAASGVVIQTDLPESFDHPQGRKLDYDVGRLAPGEWREGYLIARATEQGTARNQAAVVSNGTVVDRVDSRIEITPAPRTSSVAAPSRPAMRLARPLFPCGPLSF